MIANATSRVSTGIAADIIGQNQFPRERTAKGYGSAAVGGCGTIVIDREGKRKTAPLNPGAKVPSRGSAPWGVPIDGTAPKERFATKSNALSKRTRRC